MCRCCGDEELRAIGVRASLGREDRFCGDPGDDAGDLVGDPGSWEKKISQEAFAMLSNPPRLWGTPNLSNPPRKTKKVVNLGLAERYIMRQGISK